MAHFVVTEEQGPAWINTLSMREQARWPEHAAYIDARTHEGIIVLAGRLGGDSVHRALLVVESDTERAIRAQFAADPWIRDGTLRIVAVDPWDVLVGTERLCGASATAP